MRLHIEEDEFGNYIIHDLDDEGLALRRGSPEAHRAPLLQEIENIFDALKNVVKKIITNIRRVFM